MADDTSLERLLAQQCGIPAAAAKQLADRLIDVDPVTGTTGGVVQHITTNGNKLPKTRRGVARVLSGSGRLTVAKVGDSTTAEAGAGSSGPTLMIGAQPNGCPAQLAKRLAQIYGCTGQSAVTECWSSVAGVTFSQFDPRVVSLGGGASIGAGGNWTTHAGQLLIIPAGGTVVINPGINVDTIVFGYVQNAGLGTITPTLDNAGAVAPASTSTAGAFLCTKAAHTFTKGQRTITLTGSVATSYIQFIHAYDSTAPGVDVYSLAHWGGGAGDFSNNSNPWSPGNASAYAGLGLDLAIIELTINDAIGGTALTQYKTNLQTLITAVKTSASAPDIILSSGWPPNNATSTNGVLEQYRAVLRDLAATNGLPYVAFGEGRIGSYAEWADVYAPDGIHILRTGYGTQSDFWANVIAALAA